MTVVFMGSPDFAVKALKAIIESEHEVIAVFTQTDKPKGRGYKLASPPVKDIALEHHIPVFQPKSLKDGDSVDTLKNLNPDVIVVAAYGKILPKSILDIPKYGCINIHASLLPKYRGSAPIQWSIINGEKFTGVTTMYMAEGLDTGDMLLSSRVEIDKDMTSGQLYDILSVQGAKLIVKTLQKLEDNTLTSEKQDDSLTCYAPLIKTNMAFIDWNSDCEKIHNLVRGLNPSPIARTTLNGKLLKIIKTSPGENQNCEPGTICSVKPLTVGCANNTTLNILELQQEGKKRMSSEDFMRGSRLTVGTKLGDV